MQWDILIKIRHLHCHIWDNCSRLSITLCLGPTFPLLELPKVWHRLLWSGISLVCCLPLDPACPSRLVMFYLAIYLLPPRPCQASRPLVTAIYIDITFFSCQVSIPKSCSMPVKRPPMSHISSLVRSAFKLCALTIETGCFTGKQIAWIAQNFLNMVDHQWICNWRTYIPSTALWQPRTRQCWDSQYWVMQWHGDLNSQDRSECQGQNFPSVIYLRSVNII